MKSRLVLSALPRHLLLAGLLVAAPAHAQAPNTKPPEARPAVGKPLVQAQTLFNEGRFAESLNKVREAEQAASDPSPYELYLVNRTKAAAALRAGQQELAFNATEAAIATQHLSGPAQVELIESLVHAAYGAKDYVRAARWAERYAQEGGSNPAVAPLRIQALYFAGDHAAAASALQAQVTADDAAGRSISERELLLLANAQRQLPDEAGYAATMERLATRHSKPVYWSELIARVDRRTLGDRLALDLFRLVRATGNMGRIENHVALANLAQYAGFSGEAVSVLDEAAAKGLIAGPDAAKHQALRDKARKEAAADSAARKQDLAMAQSAKDGNGLAMLGQISAAEGRYDAGIALMEQGLARGGLRHPDEVKLRLGEALALAGKGAAAAQTLTPLNRGSDGASRLARLWALYATREPATDSVAAGQAPAAR